MHILFYKSALCPRCHLAGTYLRELAARHTDLVVEERDIIKAPRQAWQDGVRMIPALKIDGQLLSGLFLTRTEIAAFIDRHRP